MLKNATFSERSERDDRHVLSPTSVEDVRLSNMAGLNQNNNWSNSMEAEFTHEFCDPLNRYLPYNAVWRNLKISENKTFQNRWDGE